VETVGVGQAEVDVAAATDTTLVVVSPGWGDAVQVAKAGILEIADVFVVNKSDREGADAAARDLEQMIRMGSPPAWTPPVIRASAQRSEGIDELWDAMARHRAHLEETGQLVEKRRDRLLLEVEGLAGERLRGRARAWLRGDPALAEEVAGRTTDPYRAADILIERVSRAGEP
jgi:LAO/AO transport system kinase